MVDLFRSPAATRATSLGRWALVAALPLSMAAWGAGESAAPAGSDSAELDDSGVAIDDDVAPVNDTAEDKPDLEGLDSVEPDTEMPDTRVPAALQAVYTLGEKSYPESVEFDPATRRFFTASLELGNVVVTDGVTGESEEFFAGNGEPGWLGLGMQVDAARRRLWVCVAREKTIDYGEVWQLDLDTGTRLARLNLAETADKGACTDFALADDGGVFVTDRQHGRIYRVSGGETPAATVAVEDSALDPVAVGQNGVVLNPNQKVLISGKYLPVRLMRSDLTNAAAPVVTELTLDFSFLAGGADDLVLHGEKLYVVVEDRVAQITFADGDWTAASITTTVPIWEEGADLIGGFSGIVVAEGALYASRSDVVLWGFGAASERPFVLRRVAGIAGGL